MLAQFLKSQARRAFVVGDADCALFVADWVLAITGRDGAADLRGRYATAAEAERLHGRRGLVGTVDRCARAVGLQRTRAPREGDIAVLRQAGQLYCGIRAARGWFVRADHSVMRIDAAVVAAWTVGDR